MFQSPSGVLGVCRIFTEPVAAAPKVVAVSVPFRGFRGLQDVAKAWRVDAADYDEFQSPSGVLGVCRGQTDRTRRPVPGTGVSVPFRGFRGLQGYRSQVDSHMAVAFQSPSGVLGVCRNAMKLIVYRIAEAAFQSPSGVLGVCRSGLRNSHGWCDCPTPARFLIPCSF